MQATSTQPRELASSEDTGQRSSGRPQAEVASRPAPIALFVYNRPAHTRETIEGLLRNELAGESDLYIFSDAAKNPQAAPGVAEVRQYIETVRGFRSITIVRRDRNLGLAASIIDGVTHLCSRFGRAIVMEDDLLTSPWFLRYMNDALDFHAGNERVMHISGCTYPIGDFSGQPTYFLRLPLCWGWATWDRAWARFARDIGVMERFDRGMVRKFNFDGTYDYWKQLELNRSGAISTWFVFWYATVFLADGLVLFPRRSLVRNIGMDGTGVHCGKNSNYDVDITAERIPLTEIALEESRQGFASHKRYFRGISSAFHARVLRKLRRWTGWSWGLG